MKIIKKTLITIGIYSALKATASYVVYSFFRGLSNRGDVTKLKTKAPDHFLENLDEKIKHVERQNRAIAREKAALKLVKAQFYWEVKKLVRDYL